MFWMYSLVIFYLTLEMGLKILPKQTKKRTWRDFYNLGREKITFLGKILFIQGVLLKFMFS